MCRGTSPDGTLVEFVELPAEVHPFFVGTQAHPELKSRPTRPHPLFARSSPPRSTTGRPSGCRSTSASSSGRHASDHNGRSVAGVSA